MPDARSHDRPVSSMLWTIAGLVVSLFVVLVGTAAPALGHPNHPTQSGFEGDFGPYTIDTSVRYQDTDEPFGLVFDLELRTRNAGRPVNDATVTITAHDGETTVGPLDAEATGNTYTVAIPDGGVERWEVEVSISAPRGEAEVSGVIPGAGDLTEGEASPATPASAPSSGPGPWVWVLVALAPLVAGGLTALWVRRLRAEPAQSTQR